MKCVPHDKNDMLGASAMLLEVERMTFKGIPPVAYARYGTETFASASFRIEERRQIQRILFNHFGWLAAGLMAVVRWRGLLLVSLSEMVGGVQQAAAITFCRHGRLIGLRSRSPCPYQ